VSRECSRYATPLHYRQEGLYCQDPAGSIRAGQGEAGEVGAGAGSAGGAGAGFGTATTRA
jgi:hypothetical protein